MNPAYLRLDTTDDRREIYVLLARISPARRIRFLDWCCSQSRVGGEVRPCVAQKTRERADKARWDSSVDQALTWEIMQDVFKLSMQYDLDLDAAAVALERYVRHGVLPPFPVC